MPFPGLAPSPALQIFRYDDIDHFKQGLRGADVHFVPLGRSENSLGQAILPLPGCMVYLFRTFPRIVSAMLEEDCTFFLFSMTDSISAVFNGKEVCNSSLLYSRGPAEYRAVERRSGFYAGVVFSPPIENRGWPETPGQFLVIQISRDLEINLRMLISNLLMVVSKDHVMVATASMPLRASLLDKLDLVFDSFPLFNCSKQVKGLDVLKTLRAVDDFANSRASRPIYSEEVASALGISIRTLTNLMVRANGMSLQRYLRLRRLWSVRRQLLTGEPQLQIKMVAYANGFWHLGDFAAKYFSEFGELPSSTYSRASVGR